MPFLTEELFQRLPRRAQDSSPSICVAPYPEQDKAIPHNPALEADVEFVQNVIKCIRSIRSDYMLLPKTQVEVHLKCSDDETAQILKRYEYVISTMANTSTISVLVNSDPPKGCVMSTVSAKCETHLMLKGQIDVAKEQVKLESKKETLSKQLTRLVEAAANPDYELRVPEKVRKDNSEKGILKKVDLGPSGCSGMQYYSKAHQYSDVSFDTHIAVTQPASRLMALT